MLKPIVSNKSKHNSKKIKRNNSHHQSTSKNTISRDVITPKNELSSRSIYFLIRRYETF